LTLSIIIIVMSHQVEQNDHICTSVSRRYFSMMVVSCWVFSLEYSSSIFLFFHLALLFWNHTATWWGSRPSSEASLAFLSISSLCSSPKLRSRRLTCSSLSNFLFLITTSLVLFLPSTLFFFLLLRGFTVSSKETKV